tara:strand:+ start:1153 stop:2262 length:1110 start_codon:yes stop_codon:yes gene_type:complete
LVKILIGGMGRSGTSLFSKLFQDLNCNLSSDELVPEINAGIEVNPDQICDFLISQKSGVAKSPFIYEIAHSKEFNKNNISLVIIPIRDPYLATFSRLTNEIYTRFYDSSEKEDLNMSFGTVKAGLHYTLDSSYQVDFLSSAALSLINQCLIKGIRFSLVPFPLIGVREICETWAASIEDITLKLNISKNTIVEWMMKNFEKEKVTISQSDLENKNFAEIFTDYEIKKKSSSINSAAFLHSHLRFKRKLNSQNKDLRIKNDSLNKDFQELKGENENLKLENENLKLENENLKLENENLKLEIENLELKNENFKLEIEDLNLKDKSLKLENKELKIKNDILSREIALIKNSRTWRLFSFYRKIKDIKQGHK